MPPSQKANLNKQLSINLQVSLRLNVTLLNNVIKHLVYIIKLIELNLRISC